MTGTCALASRLVVVLLCLLTAGTAGALHPLAPLDTSSPRATFESFLAFTEEATRLYSEYRDSRSPAMQRAVWQTWDKGMRLLDLSQVPPAARQLVGHETNLLLWEVIARVELPELEEIPGEPADEEGDENGEQITRWRLPDTEITIARIEKGPRAGEFLFSADTVRRARSFYELARELPYLRPVPNGDLSRVYLSTTGWMIPPAWVEALPDWANAPMGDMALWKWFAALLLLGLALGAVVGVFRWARRGSWDGSLRSYLRRLSTPVAILVIAWVLVYAGEQIYLTGATQQFIYVVEVAHGVGVLWLIWLTASWIAEAIVASPRISSESLDAHLIRLTARSIGIVAILVLMFRVAAQVGIPVYGLVAGAGVGGLAVALAARSTLENFLGTLNLYADRPVRVGELCRYGEDPSPGWQRVGTVEEIGLRSTRIRGLDRTITTIPNAEFANMHIVNLTRRDERLLRTTLQLRYETTQEQMRYILARLRELLLGHPMVSPEPARVRFIGYGGFSKNVEIFTYLRCREQNDFLAIQEDILLRMGDIVEEAGSGFAFPSQTAYLTRDTGLDAERRGEAEAQVVGGRARGKLPFPEFEDEERERLEDILDYPPKGSPDHEPRVGLSEPTPERQAPARFQSSKSRSARPGPGQQR